MKSFLSVLALALVASLATADPPKIGGQVKYRPHELVKLKAENVPDKAAVIWRVSPSKGVWKATTPKNLLEFSSVPGTFEVTLLAISQGADGLTVDEATATVEVEGCEGDKPTPPAPKPKDGAGKLDPPNALGRITFGTAGCTATVIGPRRADGRWDILTASHCMSGTGERGSLTLQDGRVFAVRVASHDKTADIAWLTTDESIPDLPYANLAKQNPQPGAKLWHAGYGVDRPGNKEEGLVQEGEDARGQLRMLLNVSSGDSGGGIFDAATSEVVAAVCCTLQRGAKVSMWGGSAEAAAKLRPKLTRGDAWAPTPLPLRAGDDGRVRQPAPEWTPADLPVRVVAVPQTVPAQQPVILYHTPIYR